MNERLKQLAAQSGYPDRLVYGTEEVMERFAELIIKECVDQCADNGSNDEWDKGVRWAANQIKEHFGVK